MSGHDIETTLPKPDMGDVDSLESVLRALMPDLLAYFGRRMSSAEDAADCMSETLLVLWQKWGGITATPEDCRRYAFGIAARIVLAEHRSVSQRARLVSRIVANYEPATVDANPRDSDPALAEALALLTPRDRELILLVAWEGFGVAEAGEVLGLKADAARARYSRVRARLRTALSG